MAFKPTDYPDVLVPISGTNRYIRTIKEKLSGRVLWTKKWRLTASAGTGGSINVGSKDVVDGDTVNIIATPASGYDFSSWVTSKNLPQKYKDNDPTATEKSVIVDNGSSISVTMKENVSISALFERKVVPIWMTANSIGTQEAHTFASNGAFNYIYESTANGWKWNHYNWVCGYKVAYAGGIFVKCQQLDVSTNNRSLVYSVDGKTWNSCSFDYSRGQSADICCVAGGTNESGNPFFIAATNWYSSKPGTIYYTEISDTWNPQSGLNFVAAKYGDARSAGNNDPDGMNKGKEIAYNGGAGNICFDGCAICPNTGICAVLCPKCNEIWLSNDCGKTWLMFHSECESGIVAAKDRFLYRKSTNRSSTVKSCLYDTSKWKYSGTSGYAEEGLINTIQLGGGTTGGQLASYYVINVGYSHKTKRLIVQCLYDPASVSIPDEYITFYIDLSTNDIQEDSRSMMVRATSVPTGFGNDPFEKIWYGDGMFMAITKGENPMTYTSTDGGVTWTKIHSPGQDDYGGGSVRAQDLTFGYVYRT